MTEENVMMATSKLLSTPGKKSANSDTGSADGNSSNKIKKFAEAMTKSVEAIEQIQVAIPPTSHPPSSTNQVKKAVMLHSNLRSS